MEMEGIPEVITRQGARAASPYSPDLETAAAAVQRGDREKDLYITDFPRGGNI